MGSNGGLNSHFAHASCINVRSHYFGFKDQQRPSPLPPHSFHPTNARLPGDADASLPLVFSDSFYRCYFLGKMVVGLNVTTHFGGSPNGNILGYRALRKNILINSALTTGTKLTYFRCCRYSQTTGTYLVVKDFDSYCYLSTSALRCFPHQ